MSTSPVERLGIGLRPRTPEVEALVARRIVELAAEIGDLAIVDAIAEEVEHPSEGLTSTEAAERAGITRRQLTYWTTSGYLDSLTRPGRGSGYPAQYGTDAVLKARVMGSLVATLRMAPAAASTTADEILTTGRAQVGPFVVTKRQALR